MAEYAGYTGSTTKTYRKLFGYKNLIAWQGADELAKSVHDIVIGFSNRYFKLTSQMLGSASSVKSNIAEGYCRNALGDYISFCEIARGSLGELGSQIQDCERWGLVKYNIHIALSLETPHDRYHIPNCTHPHLDR
jgi:four helix bundle protein